jgi:hypothetical protein
LEATSDKLDPGQAVAKYVKALQMTNSNRRFQTIGLGLKTLSEHLTQDQAYEVVSTYLDAATRPKAPGANTEDLFSFDDDTTDYSGLESTAAKLSGSQAMSLVDNYLPYVEGPSDTSGIVLVNTVLVANASKFSANELDALISAEAELVRKSEDWQVATQLGDLLSRLDGPNALAAAKTMMSELEAHNTVDSLSVLGLALAQISSKLSAQQSSRAAHLYLAAAAKKSERAALLSQALAGVAGSLSVAQAASLADMYVELMQDGQRNILSLGFWVKRGLLPVEDGLGHAQAMVFATRFTSAISRLRNPRESERWGDVLAGAAHRLSDEDAHAMTEILLSQIRSASNAAQLAALARGLAAVPGGLNDSEADSLIKTFVDAMSIMEDAEYLDRPLAELMTKFSDAKADNVVNQLLALRHGPANPKGNLDAPLLRQAVDMPPSLQSPAQRALPLQALAAPRQFSNAQATQVLYELLADLSRQSSDYNLFVFEGYPPQSSRRLAGEASSSSRRGAPPPITRSIQGRHDAEFHSLTEGVVNVTKKLTPKQSLIVWESFVNAIPSITSGETLEFLAGPLAVLASKIPMDEAHATRMVDLCKYPLLQCPAFMESVRAHYPEAPKADAGYWAFVTWAHKRFPQFDPDASPPLHSVQAMRLN